MRIIVFGDSISEGFWDYENAGWVNRLKIQYWKKYGIEKMVFNAGVSAYTSQHVISCFNSFFSAISSRENGKEKKTIIVFAIGINDSSTKILSGEKQVNLEKFKENIQTLIDKCQQEILIQNVIFVGNINVDESVINDVNNPGSEHYFHNKDIIKYNSIIRELAEKTTCSYIDIFGLMENDDLEDGLHPNAQGHEKIYKKVLEFLEK